MTTRAAGAAYSCLVSDRIDDRGAAGCHAGEANPRRAVLVTGMSGTGKSTALAALAARGHRVLDTDDPGWIVSGSTPAGPEPVWDVERLGAFLAQHAAGLLFVAGCVANQGALYDRFDAVVLLSAPIDVLLGRVGDRANPFGSRAEERAKIAADLETYESILRRGADHEIVTTTPLSQVAETLERIAMASPRREHRLADGANSA